MKVLYDREKGRESYYALVGGSWLNIVHNCRVTFHLAGGAASGIPYFNLGFRPLIRIRGLG